MIVMTANNTGAEFFKMARRYPGRLGHLHSPSSAKGPRECGGNQIPYVLDNGAFICFKDGKPFDEAAFIAHLDKYKEYGHAPLWAVVPDVVGNIKETIASWWKWRDRVADYGYLCAFAAQDGMGPEHVPSDADVVFLGGASTDWKIDNIPVFCGAFPRVHVARVNSERRLRICHMHGAESVDGSGWFRGDQDQLRGLKRYLKYSDAGDIPVLKNRQIQNWLF